MYKEPSPLNKLIFSIVGCEVDTRPVISRPSNREESIALYELYYSLRTGDSSIEGQESTFGGYVYSAVRYESTVRIDTDPRYDRIRIANIARNQD